MSGIVYLVGAGPGDPDLITVRGRERLAEATVVFYDNLAPSELLDYAPASARRIYVGKKRSDHAMTQEEICRQLVEAGLSGEVVVRLKGGDPYVFGRGGEEVEALREAGVPFEVVPGVTAALGLGAYAGIPLTHRGHTSAVSFVTGHEPERIDWSRIGHSETLVIYMGLTAIGRIAESLIAAGRSPDTPAAVVRRATTPRQETVAATLATIAQVVADARMKPPATIVIGEVASLAGRFEWFSRLPLFGQRVLVLRTAGQSGDTARRLRRLGAEAIAVPVLELAPPPDPQLLARALDALPDYDGVLFTSANAVERFFEALNQAGGDSRRLPGDVCAVGPKTADALRAVGVRADRVGTEGAAEGVVEVYSAEPIQGKRFLLPRAAAARDVIPEAFARRGARVDVVPVYETRVPAEAEALLAAVIAVDWVLFTSSSTVKNFLALGGRRLLEGGAQAASIGAITSATLTAHGVPVAAEAAEPTLDALLDAIRQSL